MIENNIYLDAFSLVEQPVVVLENDCIKYMNPSAVLLAKRELTGCHASMLFPSHIIGNQAESFATTAFIGTKSCVVNISTMGKTRICVLTPQETQFQDNSTIFAKLRSSLSNIRFASSCISIIGEGSNDEKLLGYVSTLNRSYNKIKRTVDSMGTLGMLQRGELPFNPEVIDVTECCSDVINALNFTLKRNNISISLNAEEHIHFVADRSLFELLLMNLLSNSLEHIGEYGRISVSLLRSDKHLVLGVNDDGSGIAPSILPYIFERYRQSPELSDLSEGSGMGLAIVRGIAELHKGAVVIESRGEGKGTSVRVMFSEEIAPAPRFSDVSASGKIRLLQTMLTEFSEVFPDTCYSNLSDD